MTTPNDSTFRRPTSGGFSPGGFFSGGFGRGLLGGFLGAGLFGLLFGHGLFGGLGGGLSILGLIFQIGILYLLFRLGLALIRGWRPAVPRGFTDRGPSASPFAGLGSFAGQGDQRGFGGQTGLGSGFGAGGVAGRAMPIEVNSADFAAFEQRLAAIQTAYGAEDLGALRALVTPEMASYFAEELADNAKKGLINKLSSVAFLQGDLSEAWREEANEYATVAMRFSLIDVMADRASGKIVSGDSTRPQEATEVWTFARRAGGGPADWKLSAIQQA
ncbi:Tim44 domain-containing protein [Methylocapsa acidiphila]|uniref:Tim44 domain-containing protein n=1 Tax=Methylocapsa acidiphila TaxID=133552 RepID=UPI003158E2CA